MNSFLWFYQSNGYFTLNRDAVQLCFFQYLQVRVYSCVHGCIMKTQQTPIDFSENCSKAKKSFLAPFLCIALHMHFTASPTGPWTFQGCCPALQILIFFFFFFSNGGLWGKCFLATGFFFFFIIAVLSVALGTNWQQR